MVQIRLCSRQVPDFIREGIVGILQKFFYSHGVRVAKWPLLHMAICISIVLLSAVGLFVLTEEHNPVRLWLSNSSMLRQQHDWLTHNYPRDTRVHAIIFIDQEGGNVLQPDYLVMMAEVRRRVEEEAVSLSGKRWSNMCQHLSALKATEVNELLWDYYANQGVEESNATTTSPNPITVYDHEEYYNYEEDYLR